MTTMISAQDSCASATYDNSQGVISPYRPS